MKQRKGKNEDQKNSTEKRLDALIRLMIETIKFQTSNSESSERFTDRDAAKILQSVNLGPTEIAKILGKKSATDVSYLLYSKEKGKAKVK